ncbi:MAG: SDR family oxidoreductase, partial [Candidatus Thorarchaeota archaeon]
MKILIVGGTGFTGSYVVPLLLRKDLHVKCLIRASSYKNVLPHSQIEWVYGDLDDKGSLKRALHGVEVLINVASLGFGHAPNIIQACVDANVQRTIFCSTTAIFTSLSATSKSVRLEAEEAIRRSGLAYTILRPTMIYGSSRDRNMCRLIQYLKKWPII